MMLENNEQEMHPEESKEKAPTLFSVQLPKTVSFFLWFLFAGNMLYLVTSFNTLPNWNGAILRFNGFSLLIWTTVTFFGGLIGSYASSYLKGFRYHSRFMMLSLGFTTSVMLFVVSEHIVLMLFSWLSMGIFMSRLIGVESDWGEAQEASRFTQRYFLLGTLFLSAALCLLALYSNEMTLSGLINALHLIPFYIKLIAGLLVIAAALVQSAIYPFHRWLLSAMTAPTPASALMHAGFVNGSGILLTLFAALLFASNTLNILFVIGGLTAIIAQFNKLLQVNVKQKLACSTIAQMGFMIMQCGLGFFTAAVTHLILHGFYKAYLFLSSGEAIAHSRPQKPPQIKIGTLQAMIVLIFGVLGAFLFAIWTGKGTQLDSGIFLTLIVAITVGQATYNIGKEKSLSVLQKIVVPPLLFIAGIGTYALMYNGVSIVMTDIPMAAVPMPISMVQMAFGIVFLAGFFIMKLGVYRKIPWLYVKLMNLSQPYKKSILMYKSNS
ncbi:proton-conducting transporter transmembrane domain-containing protein [Pareuzebyella sediminis]|uniref:proton-conducting transporter transmembrane domain-containing protein n=1 Tax=Pareuzebyella sediminis TaxID=2607998 RepID=UPI001E400482|nr:proton-conducting transporter membrane subunit [Pareuzebyella sediminis]